MSTKQQLPTPSTDRMYMKHTPTWLSTAVIIAGLAFMAFLAIAFVDTSDDNNYEPPPANMTCSLEIDC